MSIHKRSDTTRRPWKVAYRDADGRQHSRSFATRAEAKAFDAKVVTELHVGRLRVVDPAPRRMTLIEWTRKWFELYSREWAPKTFRNRKQTMTRWVLPLIGDRVVATITPATVRELRNMMVDDGASAHTVNTAKNMLSACLGAAVEYGLLEANPCLGIKPMKHRKRDPKPFTPLQVEMIRAKLPTERDRLIVSIMAYAGLRPGEVAGLQWGDISDVGIHVERTIQDGQYEPTKTERSRTVKLSEVLREDFETYGRGEPESLVVTGARGGPLNHHWWSQKIWRPAAGTVGADRAWSDVPYNLRHTFASLLLHEGKSVAYVTRQLGHTQQSTMLDNYSHEYEDSLLSPHVPMDDAIRAARIELARTGLEQ